MINMLTRAPALWASMMAILIVAASPAFSQAPTDAQRSAIRAECRSDYQANCASVPPGGMASLQCLQKNMSSLSPGCQAAVRAVEAPAEPKAETKPESPPAAAPKESAAPAKPAAETAAPKETAKEPPRKRPRKPQDSRQHGNQEAEQQPDCRDSQRVPLRLSEKSAPACRPEAPRHCNAWKRTRRNFRRACQKAVSAATGGAAAARSGAPADAATASPGAAPAAPPPPVLVLRPMRPREVLFVLRSACGGDVRTLCAGVPPGGGRIMECLATQAASLSPALHGCSEPVLAQ